MDKTLLERKNKQNMNKLTSIINDYEAKLDARVNQVVSEIINYTKKVTDPPLLPIVADIKMEQSIIRRQSSKDQRNKSMSFNTELTFLNQNTTLQAEMKHLRGTFKQLQSSKLIHDSGRPVGNHPVVRPKFAKRNPDILPKQVRLNPFAQKNAIKAYELDKGLLSLIQKGKIGKDVNIITAFEKGRPILQTQKAIFHQGQERFAQLQSQKSELRNSRQKMPKKVIQKINGEFRDRIYEQNWALTMPKDSDGSPMKLQYQSREQLSNQVTKLFFKQQIYIKIVHYQISKDSNYKDVLLKHLQYRGQIQQTLRKIIDVMKQYSIQIGYVDSSKLLELVTRMNQLRKQELIGCLVGDNGKYKIGAVTNIRGGVQKRILAMDKIISCLRYNIQRKQFSKYLQKKKAANKLYGWMVSCWVVKKHHEALQDRKKQIQQIYSSLQKKLSQNLIKIQSQKHYQIHIINEDISGKQSYKQIMNIQITRIFNLKNVNKHIIYVLPYALDEETINYYYKIMELEEIPNYKERVSFIQADPSKLYANIKDISTKLYYNSKVLRKLKKKIKEAAAYMVVSYPNYTDVKLSAFLNIPIFGGNLIQLFKIQQRTELDIFKQDKLGRHNIAVSHGNMIGLSNEIITYCQSIKGLKRFVVKINGRYKSSGIALLSYPFNSLPDMYSNTTLVTDNMTVDQFYHSLIKEGGIVEMYEQDLAVIGVVLNISLNGEVKVIGTFQKISSGFTNVGFIFPQKKIENRWIYEKSKKIGAKLYELGHYGGAELTFLVDQMQQILLEKVQCFLTQLGSSLYYYKFLSEGELNQNGDYMATIVDTFEREGAEQEVITYDARCFCYVPYLLHFGLSDRQANSFFQLCRMGGVSFDLQNKYGATFILLGTIKSSMGLITTAKDKRGAIKLMLKSLQFILKQNSHNMSNQTLIQKQVRMKQRANLINIKQRLQDL